MDVLRKSIILPMTKPEYKRLLKGKKKWQMTTTYPFELDIPRENEAIEVYVYSGGYVRGYYRCKRVFCNKWNEDILDWKDMSSIQMVEEGVKLNRPQMMHYKRKDIYLWKIEELSIYNEPKEITEFGLPDLPPHKWLYIPSAPTAREG